MAIILAIKTSANSVHHLFYANGLQLGRLIIYHVGNRC